MKVKSGVANIQFSFKDPLLSSKLTQSFVRFALNDSSDSVPHFKTKLFLTSAACLILLGLWGCSKSNRKSLPAPLSENSEYELEGRVRRIWGGDSFEFGDVDELHYIMIRGVDTPKPGQKYFDDAKAHITKLVRKRIARISIVGRDSMMREFADVHTRPKNAEDALLAPLTEYANTPDGIEINVGLSLIQEGFGWYDGMEFDGVQAYKQAHSDARTARIGLWAQDNPIPPWDFEEN